jgi:hypothetical protein
MASLTTVDNIEYNFVPGDVFAAVDHDLVTGDAVTCVYGVTANYLRIGETVAAFLARLEVQAGFAQLTRPNGYPIWIAAAAVGSVTAPLPGVYDPAVRSLVSVRSLTQGVIEDLPTVIARLNAHGANL